jgi:hypothetical protein
MATVNMEVIMIVLNQLNKITILGICTIVISLLLAGCGGGGGGGSSDSTGGNSSNTTPVANAGSDQTIQVNTIGNLSGAASSDANGDTLTYTWTFTTRPAGSAATLSNANTVTPSFTPDISGNYILALVVNDGKANSVVDTLTITASTSGNPANSIPIANAGSDRTVQVNTVVNLSGATSIDYDYDTLTYAWTLTTRPAGSAATLSNANTVTPSFTPDIAGNYILALVVNDGKANSVADTLTITASTVVGPAPTDVVAYAKAMSVGAWATTTYSGNTAPAYIYFSGFICPAGGIKGIEHTIIGTSTYDYLAKGTWRVEATTGTNSQYASILLNYTTTINIGGVIDTVPGVLAASNGYMLYFPNTDRITYYYGSNWYYMTRLKDGSNTGVDDSYCGTTSSTVNQCGTDADCGRCWYCEKSASSSTCRYGGEGPSGCYRGWSP